MMEKEVKLYREYDDIEILPSYFLEVCVLISCEFFRMLEEARMRNFIYDVLMEIYPILVRIFFANLKFSNGIITHEVKKYPISLSLEEFAEICNLPCSRSHYQEIDQSEGFHTTTSFFFLQDPDSIIPSPFLVGSVHPDIQLIHYVVNHILTPRKHSQGQLKKDDVLMTWSLANKVETSWVL